MRYRLRLTIDALRDLYFLATIPLLVLARSIALWFAYTDSSRRKVDFRLIDLSNILVAPFTKHLRGARNAMVSLERYWETYDSSGLEIYSELAGRSDWFAGRRVLDFGCGVGRKAFELARGGAEQVVGVDLSDRCIRVAQQKAKSQASLRYIATDLSQLTSLGYRESFDYVVSFTVFEHLSDPKAVLAELTDVLKPDGEMLIVFNYVHDKWGMHLGAFVSHPWPQAIFPEKALFEYWTDQLRAAHQHGEMGYFPADYRHGAGRHNNDCFLNLNRWTSADFETCLAESGWKVTRRWMYSRSTLARVFGTRDNGGIGKWLAGSGAYLLTRSTNAAE